MLKKDYVSRNNVKRIERMHIILLIKKYLFNKILIYYLYLY